MEEYFNGCTLLLQLNVLPFPLCLLNYSWILKYKDLNLDMHINTNMLIKKIIQLKALLF